MLPVIVTHAIFLWHVRHVTNDWPHNFPFTWEYGHTTFVVVVYLAIADDVHVDCGRSFEFIGWPTSFFMIAYQIICFVAAYVSSNFIFRSTNSLINEFSCGKIWLFVIIYGIRFLRKQTKNVEWNWDEWKYDALLLQINFASIFFLASNGTVHISFEKSCNGYFITRTIHAVYFWQPIKGSLISSWLKSSVLESVQFEKNWQSFGLRIAINHAIPVKWRRRKTQQSIYHSLKRSNLNSKDADVT